MLTPEGQYKFKIFLIVGLILMAIIMLIAYKKGNNKAFFVSGTIFAILGGIKELSI